MVLSATSAGFSGGPDLDVVGAADQFAASGFKDDPEQLLMLGDVVHTARGAGDEPAIVIGTLLLTAGEPLLMPMNGMAMTGTPTP